ncbi:MAG: bifunctional (p)ppGpp synthetase/guanosine-3',5'-bis(diphosphate) 3'-pyrophosphohydrolase [Myxococcales bacterium]|nr:bifunctional (p)ppGpp synthetase/guanosine-3',5'-bis(diphosphate) 3'-pyrophosphohydrolase [Myxococcales bacterium]
MVPLTEILDKVRSYHASADTDLIHRAYAFAAQAHDGQVRKSGDPYFVHPVGVAQIIAEMNLDSSSVCAALLHDVLEDCEVHEDEIEERFGEEVAFLVSGVTKLGKMNFQSREDRQAESFRKMLLAMARDIRVLLVKLADRLDNMRTLHYMSVGSQERISHETMDIYAPLAGRLGIQWLKDELEDLAFKYTYPDAYALVSGKLKQASKDSDRYVHSVIDELQNILGAETIEANVTGRLKHPFSIYRKMREQQVEFERIHDLIAFRVVVERLSDCYGALGVIHSRWTPVPGRFKDYIALPKSNMYQSLHTTVIGPQHKRIEVQIRTHDMHRTADMGIAAHWQYKESGSGPPAEDTKKFQWLRELMEYQKEVKDPEEFFDGVKVDLFQDEVYVFTPKGDVRTFPRGSTPVDFAYAIHSEIGDHCVGARVNGSIVPLRYKLHNGDTVDILTSPKQEPSKDWLNFVHTARARSRIRGHIRTDERARSAKLGRELLERQMHRRDLSYQRVVKSGELGKVATKEFQLRNTDELMTQIGFGRVSPEQVVDAVINDGDEQTKTNGKALKQGLIEKTVRKIRPDQGGIVIGDINDVLVRYGKCCNPVPGDPITGWITRGRGVTVHRRGCDRAMELESERRIECRWGSNAKNMELPVMLRVVTADRPGILANLSRQFNEAGVNIAEATCRASVEGRAVNTFQFNIGSVDALRKLTRRLSKVDGIYEVERM